MTAIQKYKDDFILLLEAGFIAINQGDGTSAKKLFDAAQLLLPDHTLVKIGYGYLAFHNLEIAEAKKQFEDVLKKEPNNEMAKTFLAFVLTFSAKDVAYAEKLLSETKESSDENIKGLSGTITNFVDRFVKKKETAPVVSMPETKKREKKKGK